MIVNVNSIVLAIQIKNEIMKHVNVNVKIIVYAKKNYSWNSSTCIYENSKYLKSMADIYQIIIDVYYICYYYPKHR